MAVISYTFYNVVQDRIDSRKNAYILLAYAYIIGFVIVAACYLFVDMGDGGPSWSHITENIAKANIWTFMLGIGTFCLMAGFLFCFRAGWSIAVAPLIITAVGSALLIAEGVIIGGEPMNLIKGLGFVAIILGLCLVNLEPKKKEEPNKDLAN